MVVRMGVALAALLVAFPAMADDTVVRQGGAHSDARAAGEASKPPKPGRGWYEAGMAAIRAKDPRRAVELMTPLLADFEKRYAAEKRHIYCALSAEQSKSYLADAAAAKLEAVTIEPDWCRAQYVRGYALIDLGRMDEALSAFQHLTELAPRNSRYLSELGFVLSDKKKYEDATKVYERSLAAVALSPDNTNEEKCVAYRGMGYNLVKLGRLDEAEAAYRNCLAIDGSNSQVRDALDGIEEERKQTV